MTRLGSRLRCRAEIADSLDAETRIRKRMSEVQGQLDRLVELYARGTIDTATIEAKAAALNDEKADLEAELGSHRQLGAVLDGAAEIVTENTVRRYVERFELLLSENNVDLMRTFVGGFIDRIDLHGMKGARRRPRKLSIHGRMPEFTRIALASPMSASSNFSGWITLVGVLREGLKEAA